MIKTNSQRAILVATITLLASATPMVAQGCKDYPYRDGFDVDLIAQNKYVATASASVSFDDIDAVKDAREEATLEAKATLAKFMNEDIQSDSTIDKLVNESKTMSGAGKDNVRNEAIKRTKLLRNSSKALLRGVITIGDCYTKGTEVRVTVGVKQETINAAEGLAGGGKGGSAGGTKQQPLNGVEDSSNTDNLKKF
jgi:hypothetical protein